MTKNATLPQESGRKPKLPTYRVGQELYNVSIDDKTGKCEMDTWVVRTIRGGKVTAVLRAPWTWVKLSKSHGHFGWAPRIDPLWRESWFADGSGFQDCRFSTTKQGAWRKVLQDANRNRLYIDSPEIVAKVVATAKRLKGSGRRKKLSLSSLQPENLS